MTGPLFLGHPRPVWKVILYQLLTLGIYGRVWLYRSVREMDGHKVWFLDLNLYLVGVVLPVGGPLVVKWRLVTLTDVMLQAEVTMPPVRTRALRWAAFLPWIPLYHAFVQRHLNRYWVFQRKLADLQGRREMLEELRPKVRSQAEKDTIKRLQTEVDERARAIEAAREAAVALREAERARREMVAGARAPARESRFARVAARLSPAPLIARFRRSEEPETSEGAPAKPSKKKPSAPSKEAARRAEAPPEDRPNLMARLKFRLPFGQGEDETAGGAEAPEEKARRKAEKQAAKENKKPAKKQEPEAEPAEPEKPKLTRAERKKLKFLEKERKEREKEEAKERKIEARERRREERRQKAAQSSAKGEAAEAKPGKKKPKPSR